MDKTPVEGYFSTPASWLSQDIERGNEKVAVLSVFGQSTIEANGFKISPLESMLGKNVFQRDVVKPISLNRDIMTGIEGFYDAEKRVVFLHLTGFLDTSTLLKSLNVLNKELQEKGFLMVWSNLKLQYARSLLLLFTISHILLLWHPNHIFDITYIHLFRTLDAIRSKFQTASSILLKGVPGVTKDWHTNGRLCSPRVLFIFTSRLIPAHMLNASNIDPNKPNSHPLRKLELDLEYQIYRLLRKSRVITNISSNSLFALPNNQPFVYVVEDHVEAFPSSIMISNALEDICNPMNSLASSFSHLLMAADGSYLREPLKDFSSMGLIQRDSTSINTLSEPEDAEFLSGSLLSTVSSERKRNLEHSFSQFLDQHIEEALLRGFDDSVGRHTSPIFFEVPKMSVWLEAFHRLYKHFILEETENEEGEEDSQVIDSLKNSLETDIRFSDARCSKVLPLAVSCYKDGLPSHYTRTEHQNKLEMALGILASQARGPMYEKYLTQLEEICEKFWLDGRVGCETLSLTGNSCHREKHRNKLDKIMDMTLPELEHSSGICFTNYCNCGLHSANMEDPFTVKAANHDFFETLLDVCGRAANSLLFPTFQSSIVDAKAAEVSLNSDEVWPSADGKALKENQTIGGTVDTDTPQTPLEMSLESVGLSQRDSNTPRINEEHQSHAVFTVTKNPEINEETSGEDETHQHIAINKEIDRQVSTTEYLPGMLTTASPPGLLPQFSSWSLVCLGPSSLYSHNAGICDQPGFVSGTNFLLPWDVTIKIRDKEKWPAIADSMGRKGFLLKNKKNRMGGDMSEFSVKIFLGTEYQCPRGHRYMMAGPDHHLKATNQGHVKDTALKISNSDMPLYFPCPCSRNNNVLNGQLMRIHVVTPKAPVHVTLKPEVQPGPDPCPRFIPQPSSYQPIKLLASAYYVLRLPFSYVGDNGPYYPNPRQTVPVTQAKLCKGCYSISELTFDR